ncbi:hypothetical protein IFM89_003399 [Coptis chinensis]|uniref:LysM domain-containing protein n=1 Tax=Coptis chinensis TaxID=261450 RepID=A0A835GVX3_9MAGN|nr:hypothetical protein IFM89_003399 [Coptis chinensis]
MHKTTLISLSHNTDSHVAKLLESFPNLETLAFDKTLTEVKYSAFLPAVLGFLLSVYLLKSIGSDMLRQESTESSKQAEKRAKKTMLSREVRWLEISTVAYIFLIQSLPSDKFGRVLGISVGISKTTLASSAPAKEQLCQQKQQHSMLEERFGSLERQMVTLTKILLETREEVAVKQSHRRIARFINTSNARDPTRSQSHGDSSRGMELCELINMHREVVAKGRATRANIILDATLDTPMDIYNVRVCLVIGDRNTLIWIQKNIRELHLPTANDQMAKDFTRFFLGLSYLNSQEPNELSQANALNVVDMLFSDDEMELPCVNGGSNMRGKSPPVSNAKGAHILAQRVSRRNPVREVAVFEWDDSHEDEGGGYFFSKRKEELVGSSCHARRSYTQPKNLKPLGAKKGREARRISSKKGEKSLIFITKLWAQLTQIRVRGKSSQKANTMANILLKLVLVLVLVCMVEGRLFGAETVKAQAAPSCQAVFGVPENETCFDITQKFSLTTEFFIAINPNINCDKLFVGQWICVAGTVN